MARKARLKLEAFARAPPAVPEARPGRNAECDPGYRIAHSAVAEERRHQADGSEHAQHDRPAPQVPEMMAGLRHDPAFAVTAGRPTGAAGAPCAGAPAGAPAGTALPRLSHR